MEQGILLVEREDFIGLQGGRLMNKKQKISGCFRTNQGADITFQIHGYISTARKNYRHVLDVLHQVLDEKLYLPEFVS